MAVIFLLIILPHLNFALKNYTGYSTVSVRINHGDYISPITSLIKTETKCQFLDDEFGVSKSTILLLCPSKADVDNLKKLAGKNFLLSADDVKLVISDVGEAIRDQLDPEMVGSSRGLVKTFDHDRYLSI